MHVPIDTSQYYIHTAHISELVGTFVTLLTSEDLDKHIRHQLGSSMDRFHATDTS